MKRAIFLFWGGMDLLFIARFLWASSRRGYIPVYSDLVAFSQLDQSFWPGGLLFGLSLCLTLSIVVSAFLFLRGNRRARLWAYAQEPLRLLMAAPSVPFIPGLLSYSGVVSLVLNITLLLGSEALKILTLYLTGRSGRQQTSPR